MTDPPAKVVALEAYRGLAAIIVVCYHLSLAFAPRKVGLVASLSDPDAIAGTPWFLFINGPAAVTFFFVLSGYVLPLQFFQKHDPLILLKGLCKRLPRLAGLTTISTLISCSLFKLRLYYYTDAAAVSSSQWLGFICFSGQPPGFHPSWWGAFWQGAWRTFSRGETYYNTNLWTMRIELIGSIVTYALALIYARIRKPYYILAIVAFCMAVLLLFPLPEVKYYHAFLLGVTLSFWHSRRPPRASVYSAVGLVIVSLYFLGYIVPRGAYGFLAFEPGVAKWAVGHINWVHAVAAVLLIHGTRASPEISHLFDNAIGRILGAISFPVYLIHVLIIGSFSSALYLTLVPLLSPAYVFSAVFLLTLLLVVLVATLLSRADRLWVRMLNQSADRLLAGLTRRRGAESEALSVPIAFSHPKTSNGGE